MPIIRRLLTPASVYPENIRYNPDTDTVQSNINGTWTDNPDADPRTQTTFPARITSDPACDAARSVADALKAQIDQTIEAVNNAKTAFTIAGLILGLFTFGVFDIFIAIALGIANVMIDAGGTALAAALSPATYDTLTNILFCHFTSGGRLEEGGLDAAMSDVSDQIGGLGATILNAMLALAGVGGVNNLAALGTSTGDCSGAECGCGDETIGFSLVVFFGTEIERDGCNVKAAGANDGGHDAVTVTWDGTNAWQLTREGLISGDTGGSTWQYYTYDGTEHGPFTSSTAPLNTTVTTIELFGVAGHHFSTSWDVRTPPP